MSIAETNNGEVDPVVDTTLSSSWNYDYEPNQLFPELANVMSLSPFDGTTSASRKQMFGASHISQCLVFEKSTPRRIQTGAEMEYGKATFSTKVERDSRILAIIPFYNDKVIGADAIRYNPESTVIVEYLDDGEVDSILMKEYFSNHQYFGFRYKLTEAGKNLRSGSELAAGTILQDSPSKRTDGNYCYGMNLNAMFATIPEVAEDGILLSDEVVPWMTIRKYVRPSVAYGSTHFPINLYGDKDNYKPFPEIGDYVREDGLLMALRSYSSTYSAVEMSKAATTEVSYNYDKLTYVPSGSGRGRGKVIDIRVSHDCSRQTFSPSECNEQALKYDRAARNYYQEVYSLYDKMKRNKASRLKISHNFKNLVKQAYSVLQETMDNEVERVQKTYRASPMDDFTIDFVIEYESEPTEGYKLTCTVGGKGVVVKVVPKEDMPVDAQGNRAHIVMDSSATMARQNIARLYEQFINAASRDLLKEVCALFGTAHPGTHGQKLTLAEKMRIEKAYKDKDPAAMAMWDRFVDYLQILRPQQADFYRKEAAGGFHHEHIISILETNITVHFPSDNDPELPDILDKLIANYMPFIGPVTYRGNSGKLVTTKKPILIGEVYIIELEKTGDDWTSVSSGKLQSFGILSHINNQDKTASPWRQQAIRAWGETETAIGVSYMGTEVMAEIMDRNNNIDTHRHGVYQILRAAKPTNIPVLINRNKIPYGSAKPLELVKHLALCNGWEFQYRPYIENEPKPAKIVFAT